MSKQKFLTGRQLIEQAPLGATISYTDGTPRPPERFKRKLANWKQNNGTGLLVEVDDTRATTPFITLHCGHFGKNNVVILSMNKVFSADSGFRFTIDAIPPVGSARVLRPKSNGHELLHLAANEDAARAWLETTHYPEAEIEVVTPASTFDADEMQT